MKKMYYTPEVECVWEEFNVFTITSAESGTGDSFDMDEE